jgi:hypothetical protein
MHVDLKIPPPLASPHVIELLVLAVHVLKYSLWRKLHVLPESWVSNQLFDTLDRVSSPQLNLLSQHHLTTGIPRVHLVTSDLKYLTIPSGNVWQCIKLLQQRPIVMK